MGFGFNHLLFLTLQIKNNIISFIKCITSNNEYLSIGHQLLNVVRVTASLCQHWRIMFLDRALPCFEGDDCELKIDECDCAKRASFAWIVWPITSGSVCLIGCHPFRPFFCTSNFGVFGTNFSVSAPRLSVSAQPSDIALSIGITM